ncbi:MAG: YbbR-like domain-containing protein [Clostridia bacterium]|nr:YbbR-like domain-containing protein [Clostridia bacterium]
MAKNKNKAKKEGFLTRSFQKNSVVLLFSLVMAVIIWCAVTMFQTTEIEKTFQGIVIPLNYEGKLESGKDLQIFGDKTFDVDVTVRGMSYILNDTNFANNITASVSFASVSAPGTYNLPVNVNVNANSVTVLSQSRNTITVSFDEIVERTFPLVEEIVEGDKYHLPEGYTRGEATLSSPSVSLTGPAQEMKRITAIHAVVDLNSELTADVKTEAKLVYYDGEEIITPENVEIVNADPIYVTIPISYTGTYKTVVTFTNVPKDYRDGGFDYTVYPANIKLTSSTADETIRRSKEISVGSIDFSKLNNEDNVFTFDAADLGYEAEGVTRFTVHVDMSNMAKRWLTVNVNTDGVKLPENASLVSSTLSSIQLIGPEKTVMNVEDSEGYAVPVVDGVNWKPGVNTVPVKIVLRTLTNSWVKGEYTVDIRVDE